MIKFVVEKSSYLSYVSVFGMLAGAVVALFLGVIKTVKLFQMAVSDFNNSDAILYNLFDALDFFLVATALIVIAVSLYELFIGVLAVPDWMLVTDLTELKAKFTFVIVPVMAVKFVQKILKYENSLDIFYYGAAIGIVTLALTAFNMVSLEEKKDKVKELKTRTLIRTKNVPKTYRKQMQNFTSVPFKTQSGLSQIDGMGKFSSAGVVLEFESKLFGIIKNGVTETRIALVEILDIKFRKGFFKRGAKIEIRLKDFGKLAKMPSSDGKVTLKIKRDDYERARDAVSSLQKNLTEQQESLPPPHTPVTSLFDESEAETKELKN